MQYSTMHLTHSHPKARKVDNKTSMRIALLTLTTGFWLAACGQFSDSSDNGFKVPQSPLLGAVERKSGLIAFINIDGNVYTMNQAGQDLTQITTDATLGEGAIRYYGQVTWAPDGLNIAYVSYSGSNLQNVEAHLYVSQSDGSNAREVFASDRMTPIFLYWAPDSSGLAFLARLTDGNSGILRLSKLDGADSQVLDSGQPLFWDWAPSSKRMLVHSNGARGDSRLAYLWLEDSIIEEGLPVHIAPFQAPAFSPDGSHILFAGITDEGDSALMTLDRNNKRQQVIEGYEGSVAFQWSPNGEHIAFGHSQDTPFATQGPLIVMTTQEPPRRLLTIGENVVGFFWSPDGSRIAYFEGAVSPDAETRPLGGFTHLELHVISVPSGESELLFSFVPSEQFAALLPYIDQYQRTLTIWSPDSKYLALSAYTQQGPKIVIAQADGDFEPRLLESGTLAVWSWK